MAGRKTTPIAARTRNSGHTAKYFGDGKYITYCPQCSPTIAGDPKTQPGMSVNPTKLPRTAHCKNGHVWVPCKG